MKKPSDIRRVAVVGTGAVGASWCAYFLSRGLEVQATDPAPGAEERLNAFIDRIWPILESLGLEEGASLERLRFRADLATALAGADFVQENGPESLDGKRQLYAQIEQHVDEDVIIATSSSGLLMSDVQSACKTPGRCVVGHPFNPPHLLPLVEVVGGRLTSAETIDASMAFYAAIGKRPIRILKEVPGHVANRLQAALWREAASLAHEGVASVGDIDAAVTCGPGLRWALMGPTLTLHLGGGAGGLQHFVDHLGDSFQRWWDDLGTPQLDASLRSFLVEAIQTQTEGRPVDELASERDRLLLEMVRLTRTKNLLP
ncbi:MAG: 3-hydroxyacyl-CoA dehydrogenase NAD-binding domain-containing protein [Polaromonas sp.]|nr:3-hydroxyacyl-CoA dehydrogenase NAD-binding domain-containing protein [Polaromonas sp.]